MFILTLFCRLGTPPFITLISEILTFSVSITSGYTIIVLLVVICIIVITVKALTLIQSYFAKPILQSLVNSVIILLFFMASTELLLF